jgi:hypothetical protein
MTQGNDNGNGNSNESEINESGAVLFDRHIASEEWLMQRLEEFGMRDHVYWLCQRMYYNGRLDVQFDWAKAAVERLKIQSRG